MRLPIDTQTVKFAAAGPAEPVLDYETRAPKLDERDGTIQRAALRCRQRGEGRPQLEGCFFARGPSPCP
jgi:hypothetical protein